MKLFLYVLGGFTAVIAGLALIFLSGRGQIPESNPVVMLLLILLFASAPLGSFWMMYMSIRYEKSPLPMVALALFVPFTFLWYYFERVRPGKLTRFSGNGEV